MKIMKTTQSGFEGGLHTYTHTHTHIIHVYTHTHTHTQTHTGFVRDQFTTLPETKDRVFCTKVYCKYKLNRDVYGVDFNSVW